MSTDLFDTTWIILAAISVSGILALILPKLFTRIRSKPKGARVFLKARAVWTTCTALAISILVYISLQMSFPEDIIPIQLIFWLLPLGIVFGALPYCFIDKKYRILTALTILPAFLIAALAVNNYYHYYPSIAAFLQKAPSRQSNIISTSTDHKSRKTALEEYYAPLHDQPQKGTLADVSIPPSGHYEPRGAYVYVPPALIKNSSLTLPVIVLLGGYPGTPTDWVNAGAKTILDDFAAKHKGLAPIVAIPDITGVHNIDTECVDSRLGDVETYLTKDVPAYLKAHYQVATSPANWAIMGYSEGGTCSTLVAIRNPDIYRSYGNITGDSIPSLNTPEQTLSVLFNGNKDVELAHDPTHLLATNSNPDYKKMHAWYYLANHDSPFILSRVQTQVRTAKLAGVDVSFKEVNGHHGFEIWKAGFTEALPWLMRINTIIQ